LTQLKVNWNCQPKKLCHHKKPVAFTKIFFKSLSIALEIVHSFLKHLHILLIQTATPRMITNLIFLIMLFISVRYVQSEVRPDRILQLVLSCRTAARPNRRIAESPLTLLSVASAP
jgi:hypothetical protein